MVDVESILIVGGFTLAGLVIAYGSKRLNLITESPLLLVLILLPLIIFLADRITEVSGGGFKITLAKVKTMSVDRVTTRRVLARCENPPLNPLAVSLVPGCAYLVLKADYGDATEAEAARRARVLGHYIQNALKYGRFRLLIVTDADDRVLGYFDRNTFLDLLPVQFEQITDAKTEALAMSRQKVDFLVRQSLLFQIARFPRRKAKEAAQTYLQPGDNLVGALMILTKNHLNAAPVIDRAGRLTGIATREDMVAVMLMTLAGEKP
jgi:CBS domain-containing protein